MVNTKCYLDMVVKILTMSKHFVTSVTFELFRFSLMFFGVQVFRQRLQISETFATSRTLMGHHSVMIVKEVIFECLSEKENVITFVTLDFFLALSATHRPDATFLCDDETLTCIISYDLILCCTYNRRLG